MKALQVKKDGAWHWVFCRNKNLPDSLVTTPHKNQALPRGPWGNDDLLWARKIWQEREFRLAEKLTNSGK